MKKIYIASPFFNNKEKNTLKEIIDSWKIAFPDYEFYIPMEHEIPDGWNMPNHEWAAAVFQEDVEAIRGCDEVWAVYYGLYSDSGTAWECGFAYGIGKPVLVCPFVENEKNSLMVFQGASNREGLNKNNHYFYQT